MPPTRGQPLKYGEKFRLFVGHQQEPAHGNCGYVAAYFLSTALQPSLVIQQSLTSTSAQDSGTYSDLMQSLEFKIEDPGSEVAERPVRFGESFTLVPYNSATGKPIADAIFKHISPLPISQHRFTFTLSNDIPPPSPALGPISLAAPAGAITGAEANNVRYGISNLTLNIVKTATEKKQTTILPVPIKFAKDRSGSPTGGYLTSTSDALNSFNEPIATKPIILSIRSFDPLLSVQVMDTSKPLSTQPPAPSQPPQLQRQASFPPPLSLSGGNHPYPPHVTVPAGTLLSTTDVHIFNQHYPIYSGDDISDKTLIFHLNDVGKVTLPMSSLPLPPLNLTYTRLAPPTNQDEFYEYTDSTTHQTAPESIIRTVQIHGGQLSVNLPICYTRILAPPIKDVFEKGKVNKTFSKPDPPHPNILIVFFMFFFLSYRFILGLQSGLFTSDDYFAILRYIGPTIIISYIFLAYPSIARARGYSMSYKSENPECIYFMQFLPPQDNSTNKDLLFAYQTPSPTVIQQIDIGTSSPQVVSASHKPTLQEKLASLATNPHFEQQQALQSKYPQIDGESVDFFQILDSIRASTLIADDNFRDLPHTLPQTQIAALDDQMNKIMLPATADYPEQPYRRAIKSLHESNGMTSPGLIHQIRQWNSNLSFSMNPSHPAGQKVDVKVYYPSIFKAIRESHLISTQDFVDGWTYALNQLPKAALGAGRSGAIFFRSSCNRFIFKTMNKGDMDTLHAVIDAYGGYITTHASMLMRIFGVFRIVRGGKKTHFLLANNAFYLPPFISQHFKLASFYDLKGRTPKKDPNQRLQEANCGVFKDNQLNRVFVLHPTIRDQIISNLDSDVQWLQQHDCIDYSLLVGVGENEQLQLLCDGENDHKDVASLADQIQVPQIPNNLHLHRQIGVQPVVKAQDESAEIFCVAIVDFLARFKNAMKRGAHAFKSLRWADEELSTVNSTFYGDRFAKYTKVVFPPNASLLIRSQQHLKEHFLREAQAAQPQSPQGAEQAEKIAEMSLKPFVHLFEPSARSPGQLIVTGSKHLVVLPQGIDSAPRSIVERSKVASHIIRSKLTSEGTSLYAPTD